MLFRPAVDPILCFVLMPFDSIHLEYFTGIIAPAVEDAGLKARKADDIYGTAPIIRDIWQQIWASRSVIADVSGKNPNVNYELGLCHALGVPTVLITDNIADVPFDYRHLRCLIYDTKRVDWQAKLRHQITQTLKAITSGEDTFDDLSWPYDTHALRGKEVGALVPAEEGTATVIRGARAVRDACARALGAHGTNLSLTSTFGGARFDRSGPVIAGAANSADPLRRKGIEHARQLADEMNATVGDGSKNAILLFQQMIESGHKTLLSGALLRDVIHSMDAAVEQASQAIRSSSREVSPAEVVAVARTAASGDEGVAAIVSRAVTAAGADGVIYLEDSADSTTSMEVREGMYFDRGFLSTKFITDEGRQIAALDESYVLIYDWKIASMKDLLPILEQVAKNGAALLVIAVDVEGEALETLVVNKVKGNLSCVAVKAPGFEESRLTLLEDIAVATGGTVISHASMTLESVRLPQLGRARHVEVSKDGTWVTGGYGSPELIEERAGAIRQQITRGRSDFNIEKLQERLAKLVGRVCAIRVGGLSSVDRLERRYKIQTALHSTRAALANGVVPGGGLSLLKSALAVSQQGDRSAQPGYQAIVAALGSPISQQISNAHASEQQVLDAIESNPNLSVGFDADSGRVCNLVEAGIIDSTKIVVSALQLAFAHARAILQTGVWDISSDSTPRPPAPPWDEVPTTQG